MTMDNSGYIALSHQMALQRQMEVIANNIANANTNGYKADQMLFETFLMQAGDGKELAFVQDFGVLINFSDGMAETTGNPLDITLQGAGFLVADTATGRAYTRGGHLVVNQRGELATARGDPILAEDQGTILIDPDLGPVTINSDGTLVQGNSPPVRLLMVEFDNPQLLRREGAGYFRTSAPELRATNTRTLQATLERSNVQPVLQLTAMIETSRAYQNSFKLMETEHDLQRKVAERLPQMRS